MKATLYKPGSPVQELPAESFALPNAKGYAQVDELVSEVLGCKLEMVDILDSGPDYVAYSIFDCRDELNLDAMRELKAISRYDYDAGAEENQMRGPILIVQR